MLIKEYRIILPMSVEEYQVAQLYSVAEASKSETGGGEGVEILTNEKYDDVKLLAGQPTSGQFTHKIYHMKSKCPGWLRLVAPKGALEFHEKAWNAYPYCRTEYSNPDYMKDKFCVTIESLHLSDRGTSENVHNLPPEKLAKREVVVIDIANDYVDPKEYKAEWDASKFRCEKAQRGPLSGNWKDTVKPIMCCYKLVSIEFKWFGIQSKVESWSHKAERKLFLNFHRQVFCWMDQWYGLSMDDIRAIEEKTKEMLDEQRKKGELRSIYVPADE